MAFSGSQHSVARSLKHHLSSNAGSRHGRCKGTSRPSWPVCLYGHRAAAALLAECRYRGGAASSLRLGSKVWSHAGSMGPPAASEIYPPDHHCDSLLSSKYDREILSVALPALMAMLLEPAMTAVNSGGCLDLQCEVLPVHISSVWGLAAGSHGRVTTLFHPLGRSPLCHQPW